MSAGAPRPRQVEGRPRLQPEGSVVDIDLNRTRTEHLVRPQGLASIFVMRGVALGRGGNEQLDIRVCFVGLRRTPVVLERERHASPHRRRFDRRDRKRRLPRKRDVRTGAEQGDGQPTDGRRAEEHAAPLCNGHAAIGAGAMWRLVNVLGNLPACSALSSSPPPDDYRAALVRALTSGVGPNRTCCPTRGMLEDWDASTDVPARSVAAS